MILSCFTRKERRWRRQTLCHRSFPIDLTCLFGFSWGYWRLATREQSYLQPQWTACLQGQRSILPCCLDMNSPTCYSCHAVDGSNKTHLQVNCWTSNIQNIIRNQHFFTEIFMFMFPKNIICTKKTTFGRVIAILRSQVMASDLEEEVFPCLGFWASNVQWEILRP